MPLNVHGQVTKRIMITILAKDYDYCKSHFVKISGICDEALQKYIKWEKEKIVGLKEEIPALVDVTPLVEAYNIDDYNETDHN